MFSIVTSIQHNNVVSKFENHGQTNAVTDRSGDFYEYLEYFPYGETWINTRSSNDDLPYKFTGKEFDPETGYYYYGARYFEPKMSRWVSADPILEKYPLVST